MHFPQFIFCLGFAALVSATTQTGPPAALPSANAHLQTDLPCWVTLRGLEQVDSAPDLIIPATCEVPASILSHQWLGRADATHTLVTTIVTAHTTITRTVVADSDTYEWTSTLVISGHGTVTNPIDTTHIGASSTGMTISTSTPSATTAAKSTKSSAPLGPVPTSMNSSKLDSLFSSLLTATKSSDTAAAPTSSAASSKPPQSITTTVGSAATAIRTEAFKVLSSFLPGLACCFVLGLVL